jgi:hypothetical protein
VSPRRASLGSSVCVPIVRFDILAAQVEDLSRTEVNLSKGRGGESINKSCIILILYYCLLYI